MAEDAAPAKGEQDAGAKDEGQKQGKWADHVTDAKDDIEQIAAQADKPDAVRNAIQAERDKAAQAAKEVAALAKKIKAYEDRDKSEQQKLEEAKAQAEKDAAEARSELLRLRVASKKQLPPELAERLRGADEKELEQDADRLLELVKPQSGGDVDAGKGDSAGGQSMNDLLRAGR